MAASAAMMTVPHFISQRYEFGSALHSKTPSQPDRRQEALEFPGVHWRTLEFIEAWLERIFKITFHPNDNHLPARMLYLRVLSVHFVNDTSDWPLTVNEKRLSLCVVTCCFATSSNLEVFKLKWLLKLKQGPEQMSWEQMSDHWWPVLASRLFLSNSQLQLNYFLRMQHSLHVANYESYYNYLFS